MSSRTAILVACLIIAVAADSSGSEWVRSNQAPSCVLNHPPCFVDPDACSVANEPSCPGDEYKFVDSGLLLTDIPEGFIGATPALCFPADGLTIRDVVIVVSINNGSQLGNLIVMVCYDHDNNESTPPIGPAALICRPGIDGCPEVGCPMGNCGCAGGALGGNGMHFFSDAGIAPIGDPCPPGDPPAQICRRPDIDSPFPLSAFDGLPKNRRWYLELSDAANPGDLDRLRCWRVYNGDPAPAQVSTWGLLKAIYQN
jgi:hypothetical protein